MCAQCVLLFTINTYVAPSPLQINTNEGMYLNTEPQLLLTIMRVWLSVHCAVHTLCKFYILVTYSDKFANFVDPENKLLVKGKLEGIWRKEIHKERFFLQ